MKRKTVQGIGADGKPREIVRLIPENDEDRAELQRMADRGEIDTRSLGDGDPGGGLATRPG